MDLTTRQQDTITELITIGYARAAGALSDLTGHRINLAVPKVAIHKIDEIPALLGEFIQGQITSVNQVFDGSLSGNAVLLLDTSAALLLNRLLTNRPEVTGFDESAREVMIEVGNIVLNACLGSFGNLLRVQVNFSVPNLQIDEIDKVMRFITSTGQDLEYALMIHTRFDLRASDVSGYLVIILGVTSLDRLLSELQQWEERQLT